MPQPPEPVGSFFPVPLPGKGEPRPLLGPVLAAPPVHAESCLLASAPAHDPVHPPASRTSGEAPYTASSGTLMGGFAPHTPGAWSAPPAARAWHLPHLPWTHLRVRAVTARLPV